MNLVALHDVLAMLVITGCEKLCNIHVHPVQHVAPN